MKPEREQTEKKNAKRYLVTTKTCMPMTVWAESFEDALAEVLEAGEEGDILVRDSDILSITKIDYGEAG